MLYRFTGYDYRCEFVYADVEGATQLHIGCTLFAGAGMWHLFVFLLWRQILKRVLQGMCCTGLLCEQQGYNQQEPGK